MPVPHLDYEMTANKNAEWPNADRSGITQPSQVLVFSSTIRGGIWVRAGLVEKMIH